MQAVGIAGAAHVDENQIALAAQLAHDRIFTGAADARRGLARPAGQIEDRVSLGRGTSRRQDNDIERNLAAGFCSTIFVNLMFTAKGGFFLFGNSAGNKFNGGCSFGGDRWRLDDSA